MSTRTWRILLGLTGLVAVAGTGSSLVQAARAGAQVRQELARFQNLRGSAIDLVSLRQAGIRPAPGSKPAATLTAMIGEALAACGLPAATLSNLSPESESIDRTDPRAVLVHKRATLTLTPLTLPQLGRYLEEWREGRPEWTVSRIDLEPRRDLAHAPGSDLALRVIIAVETVRPAPKQGAP
jgi:hypothetical protein